MRRHHHHRSRSGVTAARSRDQPTNQPPGWEVGKRERGEVTLVNAVCKGIPPVWLGWVRSKH